MELFKIGFLPIRLLDIIDVTLVAFIFYSVYMRIKDTRAVQLLAGLLILLVAAFISGWLQLQALNRLISFFGSVWLIAIVVIFSPELRRLLMHIGEWRLLSVFYRPTGFQVIDEVITASRILSDKSWGAIIVLTRETQLGTVIDSGTPMNAEVTYQTLVTIFTPSSPLHDLAVVIRGDRIAAASCLLPVSTSMEVDSMFGSRHRAALGIAEETDAVAVVVSEERREISIAVDGKIERNLSPTDLRSRLMSLLQ
jgi:diadenylate cyclase